MIVELAAMVPVALPPPTPLRVSRLVVLPVPVEQEPVSALVDGSH